MASQAEQADTLAKLARDNERKRAELSALKNGKGKKSGGKGGKKSHLTVINGERMNRSEVKALAEKGAALAASKERERERNSKDNAQLRTFKDMALKVTGTAAFLSWLKNRTGAYNKLPEIIKGQPAAKDAAVALGFYYLAEKSDDAATKENLMAAALAAAAQAGATFGANFTGADSVAQTINEKLGVQGPPLALAR